VKRKIATTIAITGLFLPNLAIADQNQTAPVPVVPAPLTTVPSKATIPIYELLLQNFVFTHCHKVIPRYAVLELDEKAIEHGIYSLGVMKATSCKGDICWSWGAGQGDFDWKLYTSNLPLRISNVERITKSISQTIKNSQSLRKSSSDVISAVQEFLQSSFGTGKDQNITKERTITESKSQEQAVETNITPLFHRFLAMGVQNIVPSAFSFCLSSAVDLFYQAYTTNRVNDLVEAFLIFQTVKPQDLKFSNEKSFLNRAKFLYSIVSPSEKTKTQFAWASSVLFAKLLEWEEFQNVKEIVDNYIDKVYETYQLLKKHTAKELLQNDKELAMLKFAIDKALQQENKTQNTDEIEDKYTGIAILRTYNGQIKSELLKALQPQFEEALKRNDPILEARFLREDNAIVKLIRDPNLRTTATGMGAGAVLGAGVASFLFFRKRKLNQRQQAQDHNQDHNKEGWHEEST
jgi:hypothetical protein